MAAPRRGNHVDGLPGRNPTGGHMKRTIASTILVIVFATVFVLGNLRGARAGEHGEGGDRRECSEASLQGSFGFTSTGTLLAVPTPSVGPFGEVGRQAFNGRGGTDGTATLSANGNIRRVTFQGTYVVNPDCTGSMTLFVSPFNSTVNLDFVIDDDGEEVRAIVTGTGSIETREYRKQFSRGRED